MVSNIVTSLEFYSKLGMPIEFSVDGEKHTEMPGVISSDVVFAQLQAGDSKIMVQEKQSLIEDSGAFHDDVVPGGSIAIYLRVTNLDKLIENFDSSTEIIKGPETSWYGMKEIYLKDPDGYLLTLGQPDGPAPE